MSNRNNKEESSGWSTLATVGGMVAAFGLGAYLFSKSPETPQAHSSSSHHFSSPPPQPQPRTQHNHPPEDCVICLESINVKRLPCGHYFHDKCINSWENSRNSSGFPPDCPKCRALF